MFYIIRREAAYAMISYIRPPDNLEFDPPFLAASKQRKKRIIVELGSGSGFVASVVARLLRPGLDHVIATDLPEV
jgi:methylase of polypeptide subunit release factors